MKFVGQCHSRATDEYCDQCLIKRKCYVCGRRLSDHLFTIESSKCDACSRKQIGSGRYSVGDVFIQHDIGGHSEAVMPSMYLEAVINQVKTALNEGLQLHRYLTFTV